ncbi:MAG: response regulator transcription factor [Acidimicrobiia bacterium]|nr:response regulator transcription factor [Acidimicrobiia bacterium]MBT8194253.1 response regulator transcription factor [Acidimicrobiia bacterium]NNL12274.1 response regulator transcription factor [Acidimicrobiia bacterium]NNL70579.1 response regulator transcription factor [Acidimicrobiia bacterium]
MAGERVLIIEDEHDLRTALRVLFRRADIEVLEAGSGREGLRLFHDRRPELVVLDIGLPDMDGWIVLERIRDLSEVPVLMLTARGLETEKVRGLQSGADDYVTKPFSNAELVARVQALLRRGAGLRPDTADTYDDGRLFVDLAGRVVRVDGMEITVTSLEFRLLATLVRHAGNVLSPEQLLEHAWNDPDGIGPDRVKFAVGRLRRKLGWADPSTSPIQAVRGLGYRYRRAG